LNCRNIVIGGANFIGMEMASTLKIFNPNAQITLINSNNCPFEKLLGREIGCELKK
jgi:hypothetical protein